MHRFPKAPTPTIAAPNASAPSAPLWKHFFSFLGPELAAAPDGLSQPMIGPNLQPRTPEIVASVHSGSPSMAERLFVNSRIMTPPLALPQTPRPLFWKTRDLNAEVGCRVFAPFAPNGSKRAEITTDRPTANETQSIVSFDGEENIAANGRLIAAAPDMLNALDCLLFYAADIHSEDLDLEVYEQARAAIAKGKGDAAAKTC